MRLCRTLFLLLVSVSAGAQPAPDDSPFVFSATITAPASSNVKLVAAGPRMAVARVDEVLRATPTLADFAGALVTIELPENVSLKKGDEAVFFTTPTIYAEHVAVRANRVVPARRGDAAAREQVQAEVQRAIDAPLVEKLARAQTVLVGTVTNVQPAPNERLPVESEHDPRLFIADVRVEQPLKGQPGARVTVLFSASIDVMWYRSPKVRPGDRRIFLIQREEIPNLRTSLPTILEPLDVLAMSELPRVTTLLQRVQR
jgi:hypothetical protein